MSYEPLLLTRLLQRDGRDTYRGHMPGHKGKPILPVAAERIDFTELSDTGNLYHPDDNVIRRAEAAVAAEMGADDCVYCAGGSTLLIQGALAAVAEAAGRPPRILAARDAHRSFFSAMALLGGEVDFLYPAYSADGISIGISTADLREAIARGGCDAVYVTAPNYYGSMNNVHAIADVCAELGVPLIIDAAHGAHLAAVRRRTPSPEGCSAVAIFSAHKTLEAMGGAAFALTCGEFFGKDRLLRGMQLFGSSSPSYGVLASLDLSLSRALSDDGKAAIAATAARADEMRHRLAAQGLVIPEQDSFDPCRLTVGFPDADGHSAAEWMESELGVVCEMADDRWVVFILTAADSESDLRRLELGIISCFRHFSTSVDIPRHMSTNIEPPKAQRAATLREAYFAPKERIPLSAAEGRVAAQIVAPYPPGLPVIAPGERITSKALSFLRDRCYNMNEEIGVLRQDTYSKEDRP